MMKPKVSFFNAGDGTVVGNLEGLELAYVPAAGQKIVFAGGFNNDGWIYRVSHVEHVILFDDDVQQVDVFLSRSDPVRPRG